MIRAHTFVVDRRTFPVHRDRRFCGVKNPINTNSRLSLYADMLALRKGDIVFFYQRQMEKDEVWGFHGIYTIVSEPFFDNQDIEGVGEFFRHIVYGACPECKVSFSNLPTKADELREYGLTECKNHDEYPILPNRVLIEPLEEKYFDKIVTDNVAYIDREYIKNPYTDMLWTLLFRKVWGAGRARSVCHILPEEIKKLTELFEKESHKGTPPQSIPYPSPKCRKKIDVELDEFSNDDGSLKYEAALEAWMMKNIDNRSVVKETGLNEIIEPDKLEYFGNNVLYSIGGEKVDVLCIHNEDPDSMNVDTRYKITVIELKKGKIDERAVKQIKNYSKWMAQLTAHKDWKSNLKKIQPVIIGSVIPRGISELGLEGTTMRPILMKYTVKDNKITFVRV